MLCYAMFYQIVNREGRLDAIKIKFFKVNKRNLRQFQPTIPQNWIEEVGLKEGDRVNLLRDSEDRLIFVPEKQTS